MQEDLITIALEEYGVKEYSGDADNPEVVKYAKESGIKGISDDEVPWCSNFVNWIAMQAGRERSNSPAARSWLKVGLPVEIPTVGDIVVFWRGSPGGWRGHVGLYINRENGLIRILGGNQSDEVNISEYPEEQVLGYRILRKV